MALYIERQIKTIKAALDTAKSSGISLNDLLLSLRSTSIGPPLALPEKFYTIGYQTDQDTLPPYRSQGSQRLLNNTEVTPKKHHNRRHNSRDFQKLHLCQPVLFLSTADINSYIEGTITGPSTSPHSYMTEAQGTPYHCSRHHIHSIHTDTKPFPRPFMLQGNTIPGPSEQQNPLISGHSSNKDSPPITRPSSRTPPTDHQLSLKRPS